MENNGIPPQQQDLETQIWLLQTLSEIQELTLMAMACNESEPPQEQIQSMACFFHIVRSKIMKREIGTYL